MTLFFNRMNSLQSKVQIEQFNDKCRSAQGISLLPMITFINENRLQFKDMYGRFQGTIINNYDNEV